MHKFGKDIDYTEFLPKVKLEEIEVKIQNKCPVCKSKNFKTIDLHPYLRCLNCSHVFSAFQPKNINDLYLNNYHTNYIECDHEKKILDIWGPKLNFILNSYTSIFKKDLQNIVDIGCGIGHFLKSCQSKGINAYGVEINNDIALLGSKLFGVEILKNKIKKANLITFFGVIEHFGDIYKTINKYIGNEDCLVVEVPIANSISTSVQRLREINRHAVWKHHLHLFTLESLTLFLNNIGYKIVDTWNYGLDVIELFRGQIIDDNLLKEIQVSIDNKKMSDTLLIVSKKEIKHG